MMSHLTLVANKVRNNFLFRLYKHYIIDSIIIVKDFGLKELIRRRGFKFLVAIFSYYLVRDSLLYIIIPFAVANQVF